MFGESSKSKRQSHSSSRSSHSSRRSQRPSRQPFIVDSPEEPTNQRGIEPLIIEPSPRMGESRRSHRPSRQPSIVDSPKEPMGSSSQATQYQFLRLPTEEEMKTPPLNLPPDLPPHTMTNKYGNFQVQRGLEARGVGFSGTSHSTEIGMTPNMLTRKGTHKRSTGYTKGSEIEVIQTVRSGTKTKKGDDINWRTTARDHGYKKVNGSGQPINSDGELIYAHRPDLTEQQTGTGWRVDQADKNSPFHGETHDGSLGRHHFLKKSEKARLRDAPTIVEPGFHFDAMTTAMDKKTGKEFGTVRWGFEAEENDKKERWLKSRTPTFLEDDLKSKDATVREEALQWNRGRREAYEQWNQAAPRKEQANRDHEEVTRIPRRN